MQEKQIDRNIKLDPTTILAEMDGIILLARADLIPISSPFLNLVLESLEKGYSGKKLGHCLTEELFDELRRRIEGGCLGIPCKTKLTDGKLEWEPIPVEEL